MTDLAKHKITINVLTVPSGFTFRIKYPITGTGSKRNYKAGDRNEDLVYPTHDAAYEKALSIAETFIK